MWVVTSDLEAPYLHIDVVASTCHQSATEQLSFFFQIEIELNFPSCIFHNKKKKKLNYKIQNNYKQS